MSQKRTLLMSLLLITLAVNCARGGDTPEGGDHSGGGGGVCDNTVCRTMGQADAIPESVEAIPQEVAQEVLSIVDQLPLRDWLKNRVIFNTLREPRFFTMVTNTSGASRYRRQIETIRRKYEQVLGRERIPQNFTVLAFSTLAGSRECSQGGGTTTLLPSYFQLDTRGKALLLIHEGIYRCQQENDLSHVLGFDREVVSALNQSASERAIHELPLAQALFQVFADSQTEYTESNAFGFNLLYSAIHAASVRTNTAMILFPEFCGGGDPESSYCFPMTGANLARSPFQQELLVLNNLLFPRYQVQLTPGRTNGTFSRTRFCNEHREELDARYNYNYPHRTVIVTTDSGTARTGLEVHQCRRYTNPAPGREFADRVYYLTLTRQL